RSPASSAPAPPAKPASRNRNPDTGEDHDKALLVAVFGLIRLAFRRRRAARSLIATPPSTSLSSLAGDHAEAATETDAERRERLVERAFLSGGVPAVWYRQAKTALAAEAAEAEETRD
ncbi:hypothetical protein, partial [Actinoplanes subtropicus]|uniref:hypothetical protein n=1 Tax=Actinoplanes subtropicus TaxID=543632 RepID=UPI0014702204